jgi:2-oxoglutarate ferredoxin oxidoreductase subunit alpha
MPITDSVVIRITGDSGDGVQIVGEQLTISAALAGKDVRTLPDFPAEIRAPAGTIAGVSGFQLAIAEHTIFTAGESLDVLVALNPAALKKSISFLDQGGLLLLNEESLTPKEWEKAGASPDLLEELKEHYQLITIPLISNTFKAVEGLGLTQSQAKKTKNFYVLGTVLWLFDLPVEHCFEFIKRKFKLDPQVTEANTRALQAGYNYALTLELSRNDYIVGKTERAAGDYRQITGIEAVSLALATISTMTEKQLLVAGYPITPASGILHECARLAEFGVALFQAEDEIAAICACIGAAFGGHLALTCTSGPGLDLKCESLGLAVVSELPLVVVDVQRAGASTGMPTKTGQSDLRQAMYGRHGEAPLAVLAAKSSSDCFYTIIEAFTIAVKYMTPVIVLMDAYIANAAEPWKIPSPENLNLPQLQYNRAPKPYCRDERLSRSWNIPGTPGFIHQIGGLEKQGESGLVCYEADNHQKMVALRDEKIQGIAKDFPPLTIEGAVGGQTLLIGWGSTYGSLRSVVDKLNDQCKQIAFIHLRHLNPLPLDLKTYLKKYSKILVAELNTGQLCQILRGIYGVDAKSIALCSGQPFTTSFLYNAIIAEMDYE